MKTFYLKYFKLPFTFHYLLFYFNRHDGKLNKSVCLKENVNKRTQASCYFKDIYKSKIPICFAYMHDL